MTYGCSKLSSVSVPGTVASVGEYAFRGCSGLPASLEVPPSVRELRDCAYEGCASLESVALPDRLERVGASAFKGCSSLASVTLPASVARVGDGAFSGCSSLASLTLPEGLREVGSGAFDGCPVESVTVPASLESTGGGRWWASGPFAGSSLRSATLAEGSARVAPGLFSGCSKLSSVSVPGTVASVGEYAFRGCSGLATLTLPSSVSAIGDASFEGCSDAFTLRFPLNYVLLRYVFDHHMRYEVLVGNMAMGQGVLDASGSGYSCEGTDGKGHLRLRLRYEVAEGMREGLSDMTLRLRLSEHAKVVEGSVRLNSLDRKSVV